MKKEAFIILFLIAIALLLYMADNLLGLVVVSGFLDGIHPCGLTVLFFFVAFLISLKKSRNWILLMGAVYILGVFISYFAIGLGIMGTVISFEPHFMARAGAVLLALVGLVSIKDGLTGSSTLRIPDFTKPYLAHYLEKATIAATFIAGILVGLCAFPCVGGLYVAIITLISAQGLGADTLGLLAAYNFMFVVPLIAVLLFSADERVLTRIEDEERKNRKRLKVIMGALMILFSLFILLGGTCKWQLRFSFHLLRALSRLFPHASFR